MFSVLLLFVVHRLHYLLHTQIITRCERQSMCQMHSDSIWLIKFYISFMYVKQNVYNYIDSFRIIAQNIDFLFSNRHISSTLILLLLLLLLLIQIYIAPSPEITQSAFLAKHHCACSSHTIVHVVKALRNCLCKTKNATFIWNQTFI